MNQDEGCVFCGDKNVTSVAKREDVPFAYFKDGKEFQASVSVIQPVHSCGACGNEWTAEAGELIRDFAVQEARESEMKLLKDCPCCGLCQSDSDDDLIDSLHPTGSYWSYIDPQDHSQGRHFWHPSMYDASVPEPQRNGEIWKYNCRESIGGCGLTIHGDSREDAIAKWNRRPYSLPR